MHIFGRVERSTKAHEMTRTEGSFSCRFVRLRGSFLVFSATLLYTVTISRESTSARNTMKKILVALVFCFVALPAITWAQEKKAPENKMTEFHMALLKRGPKWSEKGMSAEIQKGHMAHVLALLDSGKAVIAGPTG